MRVNTQALEECIKRSGFRKGYIVSQLGISWASFCNKVKGRVPFKIAEIFVLCSILNISDEEKAKIFYPSVASECNKED